MFIYKIDSIGDTPALTFVKSTHVHAYPCGRRRSELVQLRSSQDETSQRYIPFDPEARLNTENNTRKQTFQPTYLKEWFVPDTEQLTNHISGYVSMVIDGYQFTIDLPYDGLCHTASDFAEAVVTALGATTATQLYANIRVEETPLFAGTDLTYQTGVLRNQTNTSLPAVSIDLLASTSLDKESPESYFFSGLSFSAQPITQKPFSKEPDTEGLQLDKLINVSSTEMLYNLDGTPYQRLTSLCILYKDANGNWVINTAALLPEIKRGAGENSIVVSDIEADDIYANSMRTATSEINQLTATESIIMGSGETAAAVPSIRLEELDDDSYRLHFYSSRTALAADI